MSKFWSFSGKQYCKVVKVFQIFKQMVVGMGLESSSNLYQ